MHAAGPIQGPAGRVFLNRGYPGIVLGGLMAEKRIRVWVQAFKQ